MYFDGTHPRDWWHEIQIACDWIVWKWKKYEVKSQCQIIMFRSTLVLGSASIPPMVYFR